MKVEKHPVEKTITRFATSWRRPMFCEPRRAHMLQVYLSIQLTLLVFPNFLNMFHNQKIFSNGRIKLKARQVWYLL